MERNLSDQSSSSIDGGEPNAKRPKIELQPSSVPSSSKSQTSIVDCPILMLPPDILAKIIVKIPIAQWPALESLDEFRPATLIAWRQLRNVDVERDFVIKIETEQDPRSSFDKTVVCIESMLEKLAECSEFLTSISGIEHFRAANNTAIRSLAQFEYLQSISLGNATADGGRGISLENAIEFLETTRSRGSLKELQLYRVEDRFAPADDAATLLGHRLASSFANGREIRLPIKLEKFSFRSSAALLLIPLHTLDTTRLTELRLPKLRSAEPDQLIDLILRATNLRRIEFSFVPCNRGNREVACNEQYMQGNKRLLTALASHENLISIQLDHAFSGSVSHCRCMDFAPEFRQMLQMIGRHHRLRKLALESAFLIQSKIDVNELCSTIRQFLPYLRSIKLYIDDINDGNVADILSLTQLREIHLVSRYTSTGAITNLAQLPQLKRLALYGLEGVDTNSLEHLSAAKGLTDLRIECCDDLFDGNVFVKWSEGFASNLQVLMLEEVDFDLDDEEEVEEDEEDENHHDEDEQGLVKLLEKANRLRVLSLTGRITDRSLMAIAKSCPELEMLSVTSPSNKITLGHVQEIVDRCPKLKRLIGFDVEIRKQLQLPKYRPIAIVDDEFWDRNFDNDAELYD